jgi:hypothetical protein
LVYGRAFTYSKASIECLHHFRECQYRAKNYSVDRN